MWGTTANPGPLHHSACTAAPRTGSGGFRVPSWFLAGGALGLGSPEAAWVGADTGPSNASAVIRSASDLVLQTGILTRRYCSSNLRFVAE